MVARSSLKPPPPSAKEADRTRLHELSNSRKAKWPNTIEALREKKDKMKQDKLDAEEKLRVEIDREEAALQAEKRRFAIERANKMLYDSTDRVKSLHSKLMLADVMEERSARSRSRRACVCARWRTRSGGTRSSRTRSAGWTRRRTTATRRSSRSARRSRRCAPSRLSIRRRSRRRRLRR